MTNYLLAGFARLAGAQLARGAAALAPDRREAAEQRRIAREAVLAILG